MTYEGHFQTADGLDFFERRWDGEAAKGNLVLLHGYGEHCTRYAHVAAALNAAGITVHAYDQRGFGRSPGKRGYIASFDQLLGDLDAFLEHVRPRFEGRPWFMMGHSMGGMALAAYAQTRQLDARGLIFSSPFLGFNEEVPRLLLTLADILGTIAPWLPVGDVDNTYLSRDPAVVEAANNDPLSYHGRVHARSGAQFNAAIRRIHDGFSSITAPVLIVHGEDDRLVPPQGSLLLHEGCSSSDKTLKIYEGGYHELWNDLDKDTMIADVRDWIAARL